MRLHSNRDVGKPLWRVNPFSGRSSTTGSKVRENCAATGKDLSGGQTNHRHIAEYTVTEGRLIPLIITKERWLFYHNPLPHNAMNGAIVQA